MIIFLKIAATVTFIVFITFVFAFCKAAGKDED